MKTNPLNLMIALLLSVIMAYGLWSIGSEIRHYIAIGSFVFFAGTLVPLIGSSYIYGRRGVNMRVISGVFLSIGLGLNLIFAVTGFSATSYILASALTFLVYIFLVNVVYNAEY